MSDQDTIIVATNRINAIEYSREKSKTLFGRLSQQLLLGNLDHIVSNTKEVDRPYDIAENHNKNDMIISTRSNGDVVIDYLQFKKLVSKATEKLNKDSHKSESFIQKTL